MNWHSQPLEACIERVRYDAKIPRSQFLDAGEYPIVSQEADFINGFWDKSADLFSPSYSPHSRDSLAGTAQPSGIA